MSAASVVSPSPTEIEARTVLALQRAIQYADQFGQAVSSADILRYLDTPSDIEQVETILRRYAGNGWLTCDGYYSLPGHANLFAQTRECAERARTVWPRARRWAAVMAHLPCVRMIAVTGSLAMNNFGQGADIDYLVVTTPGRVWVARLLLVALVRFARLWRVELCPNFILSTEVLRLQEQSFFIARELAQMVPLFGLEYYRRMIEMNDWMFRLLPCATTPPAGPPEIVVSRAAAWLKAAGERLLGTAAGQRLEDWERSRKIARLQRLPGAEAPNVILNSEQCKGHFRGTHGDVGRTANR